MSARILFSFFLLLALLPTAAAQKLFLPSSLNTSKNDHPMAFAEANGAYFFAGTYWPTQSAEASSGFCYKTDTSGRLLHSFSLRGLDSTVAYTFDAIHSFRNQIFIVATAAVFENEPPLMPATPGYGYGAFYGASSGYYYNRVLFLTLDENLGLQRTDTLKYDTDTASIMALRTVMMGDKIYAAYSGLRKFTQANPGWTPRAFLSVYNTQSHNLIHQPIDSAYLHPVCPNSVACSANDNTIVSLSRTGEDRLLVTGLFKPRNHMREDLDVLEIDTNLVITHLPITTVVPLWKQGTSVPEAYMEMWKPTATSSYFAGPVFLKFSPPSGRQVIYTLARLDAASRMLQTGQPIPVDSTVSQYPALKTPITLLRDRKHFILAFNAFTYQSNGQRDSSRIRIAKYDTSLNLLWSRTFGNLHYSFVPFGVQELPNGKLMVLSAVQDDFSAGASSDLFCFIIEEDGTPASTFTVAAPGKNDVKIYPNPARNEVRFELPTGQINAIYTITDLNGRIVASGAAISGNPVSVSTLPPAHYLFRVQTADQKVHTGLFTKQ